MKPEGKRKVGRPKKIDREIEKASQEGLPTNWTRATFIVREDLLESFKAYSLNEGKQIKEAINEAIEEYLDKRGLK